jgi:peptidyl-prolyl cis-trans isomerase SurA
MRRIFSGLLFLFLAGFIAQAQTDNNAVLMTIAGKPVTVGEFMTIYQKNNVKGESVDKKSIDEYLDLFINFKLKVLQAEQMGLDTLPSFVKELDGYREQLAKPYFTDEATLDKLILEAYNRKQFDIRASHIYFRVRPDALPQDTLAAFNKAKEAMDKLMKGMDFEAVVLEYSEDPSAKDREANAQHPFMKGNRGDLGYFTVFDMVYPFESAAYNTQAGKFSKPVRTDYGYHIIKVTDRIPALGDFSVAHLFLGIPKGATAADSARIKARIDSIYAQIKAGANYEDMVKQYSEDKGSSSKGGVLPKRGVNRLMPEFIATIASLKNVGDISVPVLTPGYGWHIVKLVERKPIGTFDEEKAELKQRVMKDSRAQQVTEAVLAKIKNEYGFSEDLKAREDFYTLVTDSIFAGRWDATRALEKQKMMFRIGSASYLQKDFAKYLASKQKRTDKKDIRIYVNAQYEDFQNECLLKYEDARLEDKYPDFKALMKEYRDGILLFDLTDQKVWSKAVKDTVGLQDFYYKNRNNYLWPQRIDATIFTLKNPALEQKLRNFIKSGLKDEDILKEMNSDTLKVLSVESGKFARKENVYADTVNWVPGISNSIKVKDGLVLVNIRKVLKPEPKSLNEAKGLITADYQNYLEKEWIRYLRAKYPVVVNRETLANIK